MERKQYTLSSVLTRYLLLILILYFLFSYSVLEILYLLCVLVILNLVWMAPRTGLISRRKVTVLVLAAGIAGAVVTVLTSPKDRILGIALLAVALWMVIDQYTSVRGESTDDTVTGREEDILQAIILVRVRNELLAADTPLTVQQLAESLDLTESRVESALQTFVRDDIVIETRKGYLLDTERLGTIRWLRYLAVTAFDRILSPLRRMKD